MKKIILFLYVSISWHVANAQIISTVAGNGDTAFNGNGVAATASSFRLPTGVAFDKWGNLFIACEGDLRVLKVDTTGIITVFAGTGFRGFSGDNGYATNAEFFNPKDVKVDSIGNVYIADMFNNRIRKVDTFGIITTFAGNGVGSYTADDIPATNSGLSEPTGIDVDKYGNVYIADQGNARVRMVDASGIIYTIAGKDSAGFSGDGGQATNAKLNSPWCVTEDNDGNVYISDDGNNRVRKVNSSGIINTIAGTGVGGYNGDGIPATDAELWYPSGLAIDNAGNVYIVDNTNSRIRKIDATGMISTYAGDSIRGYNGDGIPATSAELYNPEFAVFDNPGNLYFSDVYNNRVRKISGGSTGVTTSPGPSEGGEVVIYPNPAVSSITISNTAYITSVEISNVYVQVVYPSLPGPLSTHHGGQAGGEREVVLDISLFPAGVYFVKVNGLYVVKVLKE